jgi:glycosyltransferase involved in cell wall biosynthesis
MSDPVRILHVLGHLNRGGAEIMVMNLYRRIKRDKIQFDFVICTTEKCDFTDEIESLGGRIYSLPRLNIKNVLNYKKAWHDFLKEHKEYKIIHGHLRSTASIYLRIAKKYGLVAIAHSHSTSSGTGLSAIVKNILQFQIRFIADYLFACSNPAGIWLFGEQACQKETYFVLNNAIDTKDFIYNEEKRQLTRKELKIEDKFVIGHVGMFMPVKNHKFIIEVFKEVHKKNDQSILMLVGDGKLKSRIVQTVNESGLTDCVIFTGLSLEIPSLLQVMDVFFFPSLYEGLPVTIVEAQASGLPCLISDTISKEASVTKLVQYYSLNNTIEEWADKLLCYADGYVRKDTYNEIKNAKYDIGSTSKWLEEFYFGLAKKHDCINKI